MAITDILKRKQDPQDIAEQEALSEAQSIWRYLQESRRRSELRWYIDESYYDNTQQVQYNRDKAAIQTSQTQTEKVPINLAYMQVRGIVNFLNSEHPSGSVRPGDESDTSYVRAKKERHLMDYWYRHLGMNNEAKLASASAAKLGLGWVKVLYDKEAKYKTNEYETSDGKKSKTGYGEVKTMWCDTWEIYPDPTAKSKKTMRFIAQAVVRTLDEIRSTSYYKNTDKVVGDGKLAASKLRITQLQQSIGANLNTSTKADALDTALVIEIVRKKFNTETKEWEFWITTFTDSGILLRHELSDIDEINYEYYTVENAKTILESRGVIHNIREPLRALNRAMTKIQDNTELMAGLNWLMPKGSNVKVITDESGQFLEYEVTPGGAPRQAEPASMPSYVFQNINLLIKFIQDIGGMHASFNGNAPFAQASGDLVDKLSEGDQNNLTLMRDNYDDFFIRWYKLMFKKAKYNYPNTTRNIPSLEQDAFGQSRWYAIKPSDISTNDDLEMVTGSQMPYSIAQKQQMFMNLWKEKAIPDLKSLYKLLQLPDLEATLGSDDNDIERQLSEIKQVIKEGKCDTPIAAENHDVHIATLDKYMRGDDFKRLTDKQQQALIDHRQNHVDYSIQMAQIASAQNVEPIKRSVTSMVRINSMNDTTPIERTQIMQRLGVTSDAAQIQARGGLSVQDPEQAEVQAQNEDIEMAEMRAVNVAFGDNHQVHLETHMQFMSHENFETMSEATRKLFQQHVKDHIAAMNATKSAPGLIPNQNSSIPNAPNINPPQVTGQLTSEPNPDANPLVQREIQAVATEQQQQQETEAFLADRQAGGVQSGGVAAPGESPMTPTPAVLKPKKRRSK